MATEKTSKQTSDKNKTKRASSPKERVQKEETAPKSRKSKKEQAEAPAEQVRMRIPPNPNSTLNKILPYVFVLCAVLVLVFLIPGINSGFVGKTASSLLFGLFG